MRGYKKQKKKKKRGEKEKRKKKYANLVDLVKSFPTSIYLQRSASIQPRTSLSKLEVIYSLLLFIRLLNRAVEAPAADLAPPDDEAEARRVLVRERAEIPAAEQQEDGQHQACCSTLAPLSHAPANCTAELRSVDSRLYQRILYQVYRRSKGSCWKKGLRKRGR